MRTSRTPRRLKRRELSFESQLDVDPDKLVFIDETWAFTNMARRRGDADAASDCAPVFPWTLEDHPHSWPAPHRHDGADGARWADAFHAYVDQVHVPELNPGDVVIMDNLSSHKAPAVREMIEAAGTSLLYLPPYSPDFNPIKQAFSKLKIHLRRMAERTIHGLWNPIGRILDRYSPAECANYFAEAGYDVDRSENHSRAVF